MKRSAIVKLFLFYELCSPEDDLSCSAGSVPCLSLSPQSSALSPDLPVDAARDTRLSCRAMNRSTTFGYLFTGYYYAG